MEKTQILLIEDNQDTIKLWGILFAEQGNVITTIATTLEAATEVLSKMAFDMIFLDGDLTPGYGPQELPETWSLFNQISKVYAGKIFSISAHDAYIELMKKHGVIHVEKTDVPGFVKNQLASLELSVSPKKGYYDLSPGNLLVVRFLKNEYGLAPEKVYITEIVTVGPLTLTVSPKLPNFKPGSYRILEKESQLIQGSNDEQQALLADYASSEYGPIQSGLHLFGDSIVPVVSPPNAVKQN